MLRDGLFSSPSFEKVSRGFVLLRLTPGPAESLFGITAAPMAAVADGHGRVLVRNLNLRGDIDAACRTLEQALAGFDRAKARQPPAPLPEFAKPLVAEGGGKAMAAFLAKASPKDLAALAAVYAGLEREADLVRFAASFVAALDERPAPCRPEEAALLRDLTWCANDRAKFAAAECFGRRAPLGGAAFLPERAAEKAKNCLNPNVLLISCVNGIREMARRCPRPADAAFPADARALLGTLPFLAGVLRAEARNNGACAAARDAIAAVAEGTGAPEALEAYLANFDGPPPGADKWLADLTAKYDVKTVEWLEAVTGQDFGPDEAAWRRWYAGAARDLVFDPAKRRYVLDAKSAARFRRVLAGEGR